MSHIDSRNDNTVGLSRRNLVSRGTASMVGLAMGSRFWDRAFAQSGDGVIPWLDQPMAIPQGPIQIPQTMKPGFGWTVASGLPEPGRVIGNLQRWEDLDTWITPNDRFFNIAHYDRPVIDPGAWSLEISGLVERPLTLSLAQLRAMPRRDAVCTIECSGNRGLPFLTSAVGNAKWAGAALASVLAQARPKKTGTEVVFIGADAGEEIIRSVSIRSNFARSMSLAEAMDPNHLLCYEMNGAPLPAANGFPLRLIAPGWYGVASVKWLKRIEVRDTRFMGRFMARDYVTLREENHNNETFWAETGIGRWRLTSAPAQVVKKNNQYRVSGMAWGGPVSRVEVQFDGGPWLPATVDNTRTGKFAWKFWSVTWPNPMPGEHTVASRAIDADGNVQPSANDPLLAGKKTYWESNGQVPRRIRIG